MIEIRNREGRVLFTVKNAEDLVGANLRGANLRGANLRGADLMCADLRGADLRSADFRDADLRSADFRDADLRNANFEGADLAGADLRGADLQHGKFQFVNFQKTLLTGAKLSNTLLTGCFLTPEQLSQFARDIPHVEELDRRVLAAITVEGGTLNMRCWHSSFRTEPICGSTHCRAGWAIHLAGKAGYDLEDSVGPSTAGALIYLKSTGRAVPDFLAEPAEALADIQRCAQGVS